MWHVLEVLKDHILKWNDDNVEEQECNEDQDIPYGDTENEGIQIKSAKAVNAFN